MASMICSSPSSLFFKTRSFQNPNPRLSTYSQIHKSPLNLSSISLSSSFSSRNIIISSSKKLNFKANSAPDEATDSVSIESQLQVFVPLAVSYALSGFFMTKIHLSDIVLNSVTTLPEVFAELPVLKFSGFPILPLPLIFKCGTMVLVNLVLFIWAGLWSSLVSNLTGRVRNLVKKKLGDDSGILAMVLALAVVIPLAGKLYWSAGIELCLFVAKLITMVVMCFRRAL